MALQLISANRIESLFDELAARLAEQPLRSPFTPEQVVVPSPAMARWVNLQLAQAHGVAANLDYPLPASWVWALSGRILSDSAQSQPQIDPLERQALGWKVFALLPSMLELPAFQPLQHYLRDDNDELKRWQLSTRIADVLDRYQFYRPALIRQWSRGEGDDWQARLWRALITDLGDSHRVAVLDRLIRRLQQGVAAEQLPERISLFALSTLPPLFIDVLHALATHPTADCEVSLYLHSPTDQYWADLKSKKALSRLRVASPDEAAYFDTGNELLASWGRQGQALQDLLLNHDGLQSATWEDYRPPAADSLLHRVQRDIFILDDDNPESSDTGDDTAQADGSIQLHICHSPLRECQVLHDQLLSALDADPSLRPEDILVMVPEISRYAPFIEAVFRKDEMAARPFIPWNLSDIAISDEHPLIRSFFQLLALPGSRFSHSEILSYLDVAELTANFNLNTADCDNLRELLTEAGVRWGLDGAHKQELGLPAIEQNTWRQAEQRLFAGYALGGDAGDSDSHHDWDGIAPISDVEGSKATALGRFWRLFSRLQDYRQILAQARSATDWQRLLNRLLDEFFSTRSDDDGKLQQIRDSLDELQQQAAEQILSPQLLRQWLTNALAQQSINGRYFSGGVTFCGMRPMRSLPFRIICLVGMNDLAFPRREQALEFDGMIGNWQPGDPRKGDEDRYLLLETLLCTRQKLYISYSGRSLKDNGERQPSVLVQELLDFIDSRYAPSAQGITLSTAISQLHPLQAFSSRNYPADAGPASYDRYWCDIANAVQAHSDRRDQQPWPETILPLADDESRDIDLNRLRRFLQHPVKYFFNHRLRIYLPDSTQETNPDEEDFALNHLQHWQIKTRLLDNFLQPRDSRESAFQARGLLPHGVFSSLSFEQAQQEVAPLEESLQDYVGRETTPVLISVEMGNGFRLSGQISRYLPGMGLLHYSASSIKGKAVLALWLDHLALCASGRWVDGEHSILVCRDQSRRFAALPAPQAKQALQDYLDIYWQGLQRPLPVFPAASYSWALNKDNTEAAKKKAAGKWAGNSHQNIPGDKDDNYIQLALRESSTDPLSHPEFIQLSEALYATALNCGEIL